MLLLHTLLNIDIVAVSFKQKKVKTNFGKFVNPYQHRSNGGIPIFSQERILERAKKVISFRCTDLVETEVW